MIKSATQLKAKVRNVSKGDDKVAKSILRIFFMERFLERVSISKYKNNFILKGGLLVSALLGINVRATMDIDTTVQALPLTKNDIVGIILDICEIPIDDNVSFKIISIDTIMDDFDYPGIRLHMEGALDRLRQPIKVDVSTDDAITPQAIEYNYELMFENRVICLNTYNIETLLAEKLQTIIARGTANTRMRDFYDIYEIVQMKNFSYDILRDAFSNTCKKRETPFSRNTILEELNNISSSVDMNAMWNNYKNKNFYVEDIEYEVIVQSIRNTITKII
jgi:predicted nucleotidyltransferase component of viral defense system